MGLEIWCVDLFTEGYKEQGVFWTASGSIEAQVLEIKSVEGAVAAQECWNSAEHGDISTAEDEKK